MAALARQERGCRTIAVIGEPGIGKSRLAAAAIQDAQQSNRLVLMFRGDSDAARTVLGRALAHPGGLLAGEAATDDEVMRPGGGIDHLEDGPLGTVLLAKASAEHSKSGC